MNKLLAVEVENLTVGYSGIVAIQDVTFEMPHPSILAIIGPNGAGKTTLLKAILGILKPMKGEVKVFGFNIEENIHTVRKLIGYVPQREKISENIPLRARDIVLLGRLIRQGPLAIPTKNDILATKNALKSVLLPPETWNKKFSELSGGQKQKVLIARALVFNPKLLLLDEPFSAVDAPSQRELMDLLVHLKIKHNVSTIIVTHDINPIVEKIDYLLLLNRQAIAFGKPKDVLTDENLTRAYGIRVRLLTHEGVCYAIIGDYHA